MNVTIVDYNSGNISSVINSFKEVAKGKVNIDVTSDSNKIKSSDKVVLPGQGSFKSCVDALNKINGLTDSLNEFAINKKKPLLGICVGLQMFADIGYEETETKGLGWISGKVSKIDNQDGKFKLPHIGWNQINIVKDSKIFQNIENNSHMYFVHSYEFVPNEKNVISATIDYSSNIEEINFNSAHTASTVTTSSDILVSHTMNQSNEITVYVTASDFALSGDYKLLLGIFNSDVNVSKYIDVIIEP